jgi:hypothetical protein
MQDSSHGVREFLQKIPTIGRFHWPAQQYMMASTYKAPELWQTIGYLAILGVKCFIANGIWRAGGARQAPCAYAPLTTATQFGLPELFVPAPSVIA